MATHDSTVVFEWSSPKGDVWRITKSAAGLMEANCEGVGTFPARGVDYHIWPELFRLASPEAAWETVEAFHRGAGKLPREGFVAIAQEPWHPFFTENPWRYCLSRSDSVGRALFAECLRLGREGRC
ncbi:MAG TPA: hypothetical protein VLT87_10885 [Thermoanaerobaculia bacterium]|nr:hypothetical protein [Thermoanaerobaculia bacterium]